MELVFDILRLSAATLLAGITPALLVLAWRVWRYQPTQQDVAEDRRRRATAALFRFIAKEGGNS